MPKISEELADRLFMADEHVQKLGMPPLSREELKKLYHQEANRSMGLAPTGPPSMQNRAPIAGFQGTPTFPNQGGGFSDRSGLAPLSMGLGGPSQMPQALDARGQIPKNYQIPRRPDLTQMAGAQPGIMGQPGGQGPRGFTTNIQLGEDGQVQQISLKKALQKRMQSRG